MALVHATGELRHKLSGIDLINKKAICSVCGFTNLYFKNNRPRCATKSACEQMKIGYYIGLADIEKIIGQKPVLCTICNRGTKIVIDHDHATNQIRGWLCSKCNIALGYLQDNPETIQNLLNYIKTKKK